MILKCVINRIYSISDVKIYFFCYAYALFLLHLIKYNIKNYFYYFENIYIFFIF